ncbi:MULTISPECIES: tRNA (adenosine(37)-N6)-dimethylallyltransferase MiaA [Cohnella]|uniref:tRNA (adenosine(37)-N6)-dimethylallyltransferase MiaA n=1 Tax=Cohnella TaxID=329857 RepID=UPI0009BC4515|nr:MULTISPECIES: tRNA (adenosine(37)-N6)-dimethylallyltransferase MiaA [Cohnella]MBN2983931.1 tRNA (adenosine(37)-N6)-dimethylallyltransferase MiaA [Cohnella algarum]
MTKTTDSTTSGKPRPGKDERLPLLALVGPTAVGKTALSLAVARAFDCEIISGDSMQVYRGMDIGTAKLEPEHRQGIPHHMIDILDPADPFSVADFQARCEETIADIHARGKLPFIVGGTGLYVESVCYGYSFREEGGDAEFREKMSRWAQEHGADALHRKLFDVDPETAAKLHPNDVRRVVRALEIYETTGRPLSELQSQQRGDDKASPYKLCLIGLTMDRAELYRRIGLRVDEMLEQGLLDEVKRLLAAGVPRSAVSMQALGYKEMASYLAGELDYKGAVELLKRDTRRFAKRQLSWFRRMKELEWVSLEKEEKDRNLLTEICDIIAGKFLCDLEYTCQ